METPVSGEGHWRPLRLGCMGSRQVWHTSILRFMSASALAKTARAANVTIEGATLPAIFDAQPGISIEIESKSPGWTIDGVSFRTRQWRTSLAAGPCPRVPK